LFSLKLGGSRKNRFTISDYPLQASQPWRSSTNLLQKEKSE
jgi:hypothetical protein